MTRSSVGVGPSEEICVFSLENALPSLSHSPEPLSLLQSGAKEDMDDRLIGCELPLRLLGLSPATFLPAVNPKLLTKARPLEKTSSGNKLTANH